MRMTEKNNNGPLTGKKSGPASLWLPFAITLGGVLFLPQMLLVMSPLISFSLPHWMMRSGPLLPITLVCIGQSVLSVSVSILRILLLFVE